MTTTLEILQRLGACENGLSWAQNYPSPEEAYAKCPNGGALIWLFAVPPFPKELLAKPMARVFRELGDLRDRHFDAEEALEILGSKNLEDPMKILRLRELNEGLFKDNASFFDRTHAHFLTRIEFNESLELLISLVTEDLDGEARVRHAKLISDNLGGSRGHDSKSTVRAQQEMLTLLHQEFPWSKVQELFRQHLQLEV